MREVDWFNRKVWLVDLHLKEGELVRVAGHIYRYSREKAKDGQYLEHVLTPQ